MVVIQVVFVVWITIVLSFFSIYNRVGNRLMEALPADTTGTSSERDGSISHANASKLINGRHFHVVRVDL